MRRGARGLKRFERVIGGRWGDPTPPGSVLTLALKVRDYALTSGSRVIDMRSSKLSPSRILHLVCPRGYEWHIRVSNHALPLETGHPEPHLDFVAYDGVTGLERAIAYLDRVARGEITWRKPELRRRRKGARW